MTRQAKIFLAEERGVTENEWSRSYHSFSFGGYYSVHKAPVENLYVCNDDTLADGHCFFETASEYSALIILPVAGSVNFKKNNKESVLINPGEVFSCSLNPGDQFSITNPYEHELVNFIRYQLSVNKDAEQYEQCFTFSLHTGKNELLQIPLRHRFAIAKLDGRKELVYNSGNKPGCIFAFVIQGAFEMEGILLHPRDGAAFWNYPHTEMEALSNEAIIVLLETDIV